MRREIIVGSIAVAAGAAAAYALEGTNGYTASLLLTASQVKQDVSYPAGAPLERWQDLSVVHFWAPNGPGQRDAIATSAAGDLYVLVRGFTGVSGGPVYTGLLRYDGAAITQVVQDRMSSPYLPSRTGRELEAVVVSQTNTGLLELGHPVIAREVVTEASGTRETSLDVVSVDPATGAETLLHRFGIEALWHGRVAIDGSGTASDGTIYVGPLSDGSIARLTYATGSYTRSTVPTTVAVANGLTIDSAGDLYTFEAGTTSWGTLSSPYPDHEILRIDPATGAATTYAYVDGKQFIYDWVWDDDGGLWCGLRDAGSRRKDRHYMTDVPAGGVTSLRDRISDSSFDPASLAAGPNGEFYVLERPFEPNGEIHMLTPSTGGGGGGTGGGNGKGKNK